MIIDTHCHLNSDELYGKIEEIRKISKEANVGCFLVVGWNLASSRLAISLAQAYEDTYAIVGIHPCDIDGVNLEDLIPLLQEKKVVALGEIGLDYHWEEDKAKREKQKEYFIQQIELANRFHLPISIHSRDAIQDTYDILKEHRPLYGFVMHCFSGSKEMMERFLELGSYISFGGTVTFKNAVASKECAKTVPMDRMLVETDCPYLTPHPFRGKENNPSYLPYVIHQLAELKECSIEEIEAETAENAKRLFHL